MESKRESRFIANFPYLICTILPIPLLYFWFKDRDISSMNISMDSFTMEAGFDIAVIWMCGLIVWKSAKNYFTK